MFGKKKQPAEPADDPKDNQAQQVALEENTQAEMPEESKSSSPPASVSELDREEAIAYAKKYLEDLISFFGLNTDVYATIDEDVIELHVPSTRLNGFLIGQRGDTMRSLQFMVSNALRSNGHKITRVNVDIADYKKQRADRLVNKAKEWFEAVKSSGKPMELTPMNAADRRVIHKVATEHGLATESVGDGQDRHIVLKPAAEK